jgi:periplasmic protein TonB
MKKIIAMLVLLFSLVIWQGCMSEKKESAKEELAKEKALALETEKAEALAAKKARIIKASADRTSARILAAAEKAKLSATYKDATGRIVYNKAEVDPSYTGGTQEMRKYLEDNLQYPVEARNRGVEGTVFVDFVIDEKGKVREVVATDVVGEDVDLSLKEEAVRVVAAMPGWNAGRQHGRSVDVAFSLPVTFQIMN